MKNTKRLGIVIIIGLVLIALASAATWAASSAAASAKAFNAVDLPDGEYTPDNFAWSGGSGRLEYIRCNSILVENGGAYAELEFASAHYDHLKVMGKSFARTGASDDTATFRVPVKLNTNLEIEGRTTAMSQPHWIPYKIYIGKKGVKADGTKLPTCEEWLKMKANEGAVRVDNLAGKQWYSIPQVCRSSTLR